MTGSDMETDCFASLAMTGGMTNAIIGFAQFARREGLNVGIEETLTALKTFNLGVFQSKNVFYYSLKSIFCTSKDDIPTFNKIFRIYWETKSADRERQSLTNLQNPENLPKKQGVLTMFGRGNTEGDEMEDTKTVSGANALARLRKTDFSKVAEMDAEILEQLAEQLWKQMSKRLKRRMKQASKQEQVDIRRTIRGSLEQGGDPIKLRFKGKKPKKMRLVVLLDVSGSMDKYSFFLLRFIWALQSYFEEVESFIFSTHLRRITEDLKTNGLEKTLELLSNNADNWSSGTKIGDCLKAFNEQYAKRILSRSSFVIVLSDGLDTGEKGVLENEIQKIRRRTKRLIWLNPLKGMTGYQPTARGMSEALPHVDVFQSAHNLDSILELEKILINA